jgi:hypothetical protein
VGHFGAGEKRKKPRFTEKSMAGLARTKRDRASRIFDRDRHRHAADFQIPGS